MERYSIQVSPHELLTNFVNMLQIRIVNQGDQAVREVSARVECRLVAGGKIRERYLVGENKFAGDISSDGMMLEWKMELSKKGPLTFSSGAFSFEHVVLVTITDLDGTVTTKEVPLVVVPGRIMERSGGKE